MANALFNITFSEGGGWGGGGDTGIGEMGKKREMKGGKREK